MKIWKRIILGFISVIIIMIIVDATALMNNIQIIGQVNDLEHSKRIELAESNKVAFLIQRIKSNLRELFLEMDNNERTDEITYAREIVNTNITDLILAIKTLRDATHKGYSFSEDEEDIKAELEELSQIDSLDTLKPQFVSSIEETLNLLDKGELDEAKDYFEYNVEPVSRKIQNLISHIVEDADREVAWSINQLNTKVDKASMLGIYLTILSILLSLTIGLYISKSISEPLYKLISGTKEISNGNLETTVKLKTKGELQILADSFNDMSKELKARITAINKLNKELEESNQTKDKYFSIIAHDLKNPFNAILGFTDLLVEQYHDFDEDERKTMILELNKSSKIVYDLLENLLTWSRAQSGKIELYPKNLSLNSIIEDCVISYSRNAEQKHIDLIKNIPNGVNVYADQFTITVIINNILNNAVKFTPDKGSVTISAIKTKNWIQVSIKDTGIGMSREIIDYLLQSKKIDSTPGTRNEKGTGLGLTLIRDFIKKNNGTLAIESEPDKGTDFKFTLPADESSLSEV